MHPLSRMNPIFDGLISQLNSDFGFEMAPKNWSPAVSIHETDTHLTVEAEIPGIPPEAVDITITGNILTLKGEKSRELRKDDSEGRPRVVERSFGSFSRQIRLPAAVDGNAASATSENGVLRLLLPKTSQPKKIQVRPSNN